MSDIIWADSRPTPKICITFKLANDVFRCKKVPWLIICTVNGLSFSRYTAKIFENLTPSKMDFFGWGEITSECLPNALKFIRNGSYDLFYWCLKFWPLTQISIRSKKLRSPRHSDEERWHFWCRSEKEKLLHWLLEEYLKYFISWCNAKFILTVISIQFKVWNKFMDSKKKRRQVPRSERGQFKRTKATIDDIDDIKSIFNLSVQ